MALNNAQICNQIQTTNKNSSLSNKSDQTLDDDVVSQAMIKIKEHFSKNIIDEEKLAQFMYTILTLDLTYNDGKLSTDSIQLDQIIHKMLHEISDVNVSNFIEKILGEDTAKSVFDRLSTEKVDTIVGKLLGEDTKELLSAKLETDDLDDLLNKLVDEKLNMEDDSDALHPNFDEFINKIIGKEVEEFLRRKFNAYAANPKLKISETPN